MYADDKRLPALKTAFGRLCPANASRSAPARRWSSSSRMETPGSAWFIAYGQGSPTAAVLASRRFHAGRHQSYRCSGCMGVLTVTIQGNAGRRRAGSDGSGDSRWHGQPTANTAEPRQPVSVHRPGNHRPRQHRPEVHLAAYIGVYGNACSVTAGPTGDDLDTSGRRFQTSG